MSKLRMRELFSQLDAATEPGEGGAPSREQAESGRQDVFREFLWRMDSHPSPEVRYWSCYWLIWERTPCAEFIEVLQKLDEYPEIRAQAAEGLANALDCCSPRFAWFRRAESALIESLDDPAVQVRWWSSFALGVARSKKAVPKTQGFGGGRPYHAARLVDRRGRGRGRALEHRGQSPSRSTAFRTQHLVLERGAVPR